MLHAMSSSRPRLLTAALLLFTLTLVVGIASVEMAPVAVHAQEPAPEETTTESGGGTSSLTWFINALGWYYAIAFLAMSFIYVALLVMNIMAARRDNMVPMYLVEAFENHVKEKRYQEAYEMAKNDETFLGKVLSAGLGRLSSGYPQAIEAMQEVGQDENMKIEHRLSYIALIGTIAPMVGLLGTVDGMVRAFMVIATSDTTPKPAELAAGISTALITTLVGLVIAIPAILSYNLLKNRFARMSLEVGILSEQLMSRFQNVGKKA